MSIYLFSIGETIENKFSILATLGRGSFSQVYKAEDLLMGAVCVLKVLQPADDAVDSLGKLREEANIYRKLGRHKHIAQLLDTNKFAQRDDLLYLKLEYIEGKTIEAYLKESQGPPPPISINKTRQIILELLEALDFMHNRPEPILHRDIKPSNLILSPTRGLVVIDFNVSKVLVAGEGAQTLVGTLPYIPPENISRGTDWDITGDLYAVGVLLYKMLTNEDPPFSTRTGSSLDLSLSDFKETLSALPVDVIDILIRAIAFKPQDRFQSAREMQEAIEKKWPIDQAKTTSEEAKDMNIDNVIKPDRKVLNSLVEVEDTLNEWEAENLSQDWLADQASLIGAVGDYLRTRQPDDDQMHYEEARSCFIRCIRPILVDALANSESELDELKKIRLSAENFEATQTRARAVQTLLETAGGLRWALSDTGRALLDKGNGLIKPLLYSLEHWGLFLQVAKQAEDYLKEAKTLDAKTSSGAAAAALAGDADNVVKALEQNLDTSDDSWLRTEFLTLKQRVGSFYSELRSRHEIPTTATEVEPLADLIQQWCELPSGTRVTYYPRLADNDVAEMNISDALNAARDRYEIAVNKRIDEKYATKARNYLQDQEGREGRPVRQPDRAKVELARWEELPGVNKSIILSPDRKVLIEKRLKPLTEEVEKEYQKWSNADKYIGHAQGVVSVDPLEAYQEYKKALKDYAYHAALPDLLLKIRAQAAQALSGGIREAEQAAQSESWATVRQKLIAVNGLATLVESPAADHKEKLADLQGLIDDYIIPLEKTDDPSQELVLLKRLQTDYPAYWSQWEKYPARLKQLQVRQAVDGLLEDVDRLTHKAASVIELRQLRNDLNARPELNKSSNQTKDEREKELRQALTKVGAWLGYTQARDELRKEDELKTFSIDEVDEIYVPVLDLTVVQNGLAAAEKNSAANKAATDDGFSFRLKRLQTKDKEVTSILTQVRRERSTVAEPDVAQLSRWRDTLKGARKIPSSHIREILALYRDVQAQLHETAADRLKALLRDNLTNYFVTTYKDGRFNKSANTELEKEIKDLQEKCGRDPKDPLVQTAIVAQAFTRAHRTQAQATNDWTNVKKNWDSARQFEPDEMDTLSAAGLEDLQQYAENQYKQAWKQTVFANALHNTDIKAEPELWELCQDVALRHDWEVWYEHGRLCLTISRQWLQKKDDEQRQPAETYLNKASSSLGRAQTFVLVQQKRVPDSKQKEVDNTVSECAGWMRVVALDNQICKTLLLNSEDSDAPIASADCQRAVTDYNNATGEGQRLESAQQKTLTDMWLRRRKAALQHLEIQYPKIAGVTVLFDQLDNLVARAILQPNNPNIATLIQEHFERTLSSLEKDVHPEMGGITFDMSGAIFRRYYQQRHSEIPSDEKIADLQKEISIAQQRQADTLRLALPLTQLKADLYINRLNLVDDKLDPWHKLVTAGLINPLIEAKNKAVSGLCDPQHFKTARYILRMSGGNDASDIARIDSNFTNHITVNWHKTYLVKQEKRQKRQQGHFDAIGKILSDEAAIFLMVEQALKAKTPLSFEQIANLERQTNGFKEAVGRMDRMQKDEPDDACCLQSQIEYDAPYEPVIERDDGYYGGLDNARLAVISKIKQHDQAVAWVAERRADYENPRHAVSLSAAMQMVNKLANHSKLGLIAAHKFLTVVKGDNGQSRYQGGWTTEFEEHAKNADVALPLEAAWLPGGIYENAFTLHGLLGGCQESRLKEYLNVITFFAITEAPNQKRRQLCREIEQDIQSANAKMNGHADAQQKNLQERIDLFQEKWDQFRQAVDDLYAVPRWRRRRLMDQPEWKALIEAKNDFCEICPNYQEFTRTLEDLSNDLSVRKLDCDYD